MLVDKSLIFSAINRYNEFLDSCKTTDGYFKFTIKSETSSYALCFAIFGYHLIRKNDIIQLNRENWICYLLEALRLKRKAINLNKTLSQGILINKPYLQHLAFTLSALSILKYDFDDEIKDILQEAIPFDIKKYLTDVGCIGGIPGSGNFAMFCAIFLITLNKKYGIKNETEIDSWIEFHVKHMNQFGFWGNKKSMRYLYFQNGYHQYEILNYLGIKGQFWSNAAVNVLSLQDEDGYFAPYPGGGGCYDYDAIFFATTAKNKDSFALERTLNSLVNYQNIDGGFCESKHVRPRSLSNLIKQFDHLVKSPSKVRCERFKYILALQLNKNARIHTHWTAYSRKWDESDMWDSWFRMLTIARIDLALNYSMFNWGFINFPGIGYHESFKE
jgi:prenyltransferase beta subunit